VADDVLRLLHRTIGCGEVTVGDADARRDVVLTGWVHRRRDLGQLIFVELRDATGRVQIVFDPDHAAIHAIAEKLHAEDVVGVRGTVVIRESRNPQAPDGRREVRAAEIVVHNPATGVPFPVDDEAEANEEQRLKHRYVDLRRPPAARDPPAAQARGRLARGPDAGGFVEIETPIHPLDPGRRADYLVASRVHPGRFYALPQSPQIYKQLLMVSGFDRYFQIARCFRDEDLRNDRQPEFTQIDLEMSFAEPESIYAVVEPLIQAMFRAVGRDVPAPFPRMPYDEAMRRFGVDRPDTRFGLELKDAGPAAARTGFPVFDAAIASGGAIRGLAVPGGGSASRKQLDVWTAWAKDAGAKGLVWIKHEARAPSSVGAEDPRRSEVPRARTASGGRRRRRLDRRRHPRGVRSRSGSPPSQDRGGARPHSQGSLGPSLGRAVPAVHARPRRGPLDGHAPSVHRSAVGRPRQARHRSGGRPRASLRSRPERYGDRGRLDSYPPQRRPAACLPALAIGPEEADAKFGFLLRALQSGAPRTAGSRSASIACAPCSSGGVDSGRHRVPKTTSASDLMCDSPSEVDEKQLRELRIAIVASPKPAATMSYAAHWAPGPPRLILGAARRPTDEDDQPG
jgi:aspartyl-tRNA synthetase